MRYMIRWDNQGKFLMDGDLREAGCTNPLFRTPAQRQGMGDQGEVKSAMLQPASFSLVELLDRRALSDDQVRYLIGWQALLLGDLLQRRCITVRYAEQALFNLDVLQRIERRRLKECVEVVDWGMQLEDWEAHTPEHLPEALSTIARLAQRLLVPESKRRGKRERQKTSPQTSAVIRRHAS